MTSEINLFTVQRKLFFLYVLQYLNINFTVLSVCFKLSYFIRGECLEDFCHYHVLLFLPLLRLVIIKRTASVREADCQSCSVTSLRSRLQGHCRSTV